MTKKLNKNNLKQSDVVLIEQAWEDTAGYHHDEYAEIIAIKDNGELELNFLNATKEVNRFLEGAEFFANDYKKN